MLPKFKFYKEKIFKFEINNLRLDAIRYASSKEPTKSYLSNCIKNGNIASGSIPILNKNVAVIVYNFFSLNYGIRKDLWLNISLTNKDCRGRMN